MSPGTFIVKYWPVKHRMNPCIETWDLSSASSLLILLALTLDCRLTTTALGNVLDWRKMCLLIIANVLALLCAQNIVNYCRGSWRDVRWLVVLCKAAGDGRTACEARWLILARRWLCQTGSLSHWIPLGLGINHRLCLKLFTHLFIYGKKKKHRGGKSNPNPNTFICVANQRLSF